MKSILNTMIFLLYAHMSFAESVAKCTNVSLSCLLAESISLELTNNLGEDTVISILQQKSSDDIIQDVCTYAAIFENWAKGSLPPIQGQKSLDAEDKGLSETAIKMLRIKQLNDNYIRFIEPIAKYGHIITLEMSEVANRHETSAVPCLERIAQTKLPDLQNVAISGRIRFRYQNPAADAWLILIMPQGLSEEKRSEWLAEFISRERALGNKGKRWAIEAAERMLKKFERKRKSPSF